MLAFFGRRQNCSPAGAIIWGIVLPCLALHWVALSCCMPYATRLGVPFVVQLFHGLKNRRHKDTIACNNPCEIGQQQCVNCLPFPALLSSCSSSHATSQYNSRSTSCFVYASTFLSTSRSTFCTTCHLFNILCVLFVLLLQQGTYSCLRSTFTLSLIVLSS